MYLPPWMQQFVLFLTVAVCAVGIVSVVYTGNALAWIESSGMWIAIIALAAVATLIRR